EAVERRLSIDRIAGASVIVTVMIAGDGEDRGGVVLVGLIELAHVKLALAIEINDVAEIVEKSRRRLAALGTGDLVRHGLGDGLLDVVAVNTASVARGMEREGVALSRSFGLLGQNHVHREAQVGQICDRRRDVAGGRFCRGYWIADFALGFAEPACGL